MAGVSVYVAFQQQIKTLCLNDFPCGTGSWNRSRFVAHVVKKSKLLKYQGEKEEEQEIGAEEEELRALLEFLSYEHSPWTSRNLSPENRYLRKLSVYSPTPVDENLLCFNLKALRLVDKQISKVDKDLLRFQNIEGLTLSANRITTIDSANLPRKLKILELCTNRISSLKDLCNDPPPELQHLGLSYNKLFFHSEYKYISDNYWPNLISLDLSFNDFVDLMDIVAHIALLPKLKNLILQGNPFAFLPNYRGFVIDSLPNLTALDDVLISSDERHTFKLMSKYEEFNNNVARVTIKIGNVTGIPNPVDPLEELPEFPIIKRNYFVTYEFLEDQQDFTKLNIKDTRKGKRTSQITISSSEISSTTDSYKAQIGLSPEPVVSTKSLPALEFSTVTLPVPGGGVRHLPKYQRDIKSLPTQWQQVQSVIIHQVSKKPWADPIMCHYTLHYSVTDLSALKKLLLKGLIINVIEEKILSWPVELPDFLDASEKEKGKGKDRDSAKGGKNSGKEPKRQGSAKDQKAKGSAKDKKGRDSTKDKKGKDSAKDLKKIPTVFQSDAPTERVLGTYCVDLNSMFTGGPAFKMFCDLGIPEKESKPKPPTPDIKETKKRKNAKKKDEKSSKAGKGSATKPKHKLDKLDLKKGKKKSDSVILEEVPPKHLFVEFKIQFQRWFSTAEAWKGINIKDSTVVFLKL
ncbi:leucine-rich repeat-containing protein 43 [Amblyraja radiata]|uniref:leucine-rich repeat-containing protein 43 n=1 Tax=Amblyraja radiata TaxID=386614 RepID=UPI001403EC36|nr:leucine-rich repeat-containing protein 43 [Amblyraja radiata]